MGAERKWRRMGARNIREARGLIKGLALHPGVTCAGVGGRGSAVNDAMD